MYTHKNKDCNVKKECLTVNFQYFPRLCRGQSTTLLVTKKRNCWTIWHATYQRKCFCSFNKKNKTALLCKAISRHVQCLCFLQRCKQLMLLYKNPCLCIKPYK